MAKIALIRTPIIQPSHHIGSLRAVPSIGIAYINAQLKNANHETIVIDAPGEGIHQYSKIKGTDLIINGLTAHQICQKIPKDIDIIAISVMHANEWIYDKFIIKFLKKKFNNARLIIGGENATGSFKLILKECPEIDVIVLGEADLKINPTIECLLQQKSLSALSDVAYIANGEIVRTNKSSNIKNLGALLPPAWEDFPLENYFFKQSSISGFNKRSVTMIATRGCPHTCTFCTVPNMWNAKWNARDPQDVIDEIMFLKNKYNILHVDFVDLTFALNRNWTIEFCNKMIDQKINIAWSLPIGTRVENLDDNLIKLIRKAGCIRVLYSPESGSKETLARIKKRLSLSDMDKVIISSSKNKLIVKLATIFGFPGQTKKEAFNTYLYILKAAFFGVNDVVCLCFIPYPGTELYDELVSQKKLDPNSEPIRLNNDIKSMKSWSEHISSQQVRMISFIGMASFYSLQFLIRPWRICYLIKNIFIKKEPVTNLESLIYNKIHKSKINYFTEEDLSSII